jgi:hypothetical protein
MKTKWTVKGKPTKVYDIVAYRLTADNRDGRFESKWGTLADVRALAINMRQYFPRGWIHKRTTSSIRPDGQIGWPNERTGPDECIDHWGPPGDFEGEVD